MAEKDETSGGSRQAGNGPGASAPTAAGGPQATDPNAPRMNVLAQYVKDLSFENPEAPASLSARQQPRIQISIQVQPRQIQPGEVEVSLKLDVTAKEQDRTLFAAELVYAGLFRFTNIPEQNIAPLTMIECPRLLFPFARQVLAEATRNGGFPPLMLDPVDFAALYRERQRQEGRAASGAPQPANLS